MQNNLSTNDTKIRVKNRKFRRIIEDLFPKKLKR